MTTTTSLPTQLERTLDAHSFTSSPKLTTILRFILLAVVSAVLSFSSAQPFNSTNSLIIFDYPTVPKFALSVDPAKWAALQANARAGEWEHADIKFESTLIANVGIRFKGGAGTLFIRLSGTALDPRKCVKLSMQINFSKYVSNSRFYGLQTLSFHSMTRGSGNLTAEKISYSLFRNMGVVAPRSHWATLCINGDDFGLFSFVEHVESAFLTDRFPGADTGSLWKEVWIENTTAASFTAALETNSGLATANTGIFEFQAAMANASAATRFQTLQAYMDVRTLYNYMAVNDAIGNWDGITAWYNNGTYNHNYMMYVLSSFQVIRPVPRSSCTAIVYVTPAVAPVYSQLIHLSLSPLHILACAATKMLQSMASASSLLFHWTWTTLSRQTTLGILCHIGLSSHRHVLLLSCCMGSPLVSLGANKSSQRSHRTSHHTSMP
jgi:CotH kinase protein